MPPEIARILILVGTIYVVAGMVFALYFVARGINRVDPAARGSGIGFRLLMLPGAAGLWPLLLRRVLRGDGKERS